MPTQAEVRTAHRGATPLSLDQAAEYVVGLAERRDPRFSRAAARLVVRLVQAGGSRADQRAATELLKLAVTDPDEARAGLAVVCAPR